MWMEYRGSKRSHQSIEIDAIILILKCILYKLTEHLQLSNGRSMQLRICHSNWIQTMNQMTVKNGFSIFIKLQAHNCTREQAFINGTWFIDSNQLLNRMCAQCAHTITPRSQFIRQKLINNLALPTSQIYSIFLLSLSLSSCSFYSIEEKWSEIKW